MEIVGMEFQKKERSYHSTPKGWRLATFKEAEEGLEIIKKPKFLEKWDRVRLLDGWILGPGYDFKMGNDFKGCLGYMLLIKTTEVSGCAYANVDISDSQKQVALLLCTDDWNYEVVYWLFNSWEKTDTMDLQDVIQGRIPFSYREKFEEMNTKVCSLARKLGNEGPVSAKEAKMSYSGSHSAKDVLSNMIKIVDEEDIEQYSIHAFFQIETWMESCFPSSLAPTWLKEVSTREGAEWNNIADTFWDFLSESYAGTMIEIFATLILAEICKLNDKCDLKNITSSQKNFMVASSILFCLSAGRTDIIHAPLAHDCGNSCAAKMINYVASNFGLGDIPRFNQTLQNNAMWRCYDQIRNYDILNKLLIIAARCYASRWLQTKEDTEILVVNRLLNCGAQPEPAYAIFGYKKITALRAAVVFIEREDIKTEVAKSLFKKCNKEQREQLVNAKGEDGWTALHIASYEGEPKTSQALLDLGAKLNMQLKDDKTALHIAVEMGNDAVVNVFMKHKDIIERLIDSKDKLGESPLDKAVAKTNIKLVAILLVSSKQPEAYFDKVDEKELLRHSLLIGSVNIVKILIEKGTKLPAGEFDHEEKTAFHLAAMCEDDSKAMDMVNIVFEYIKGKEDLAAKRDKRGRTALHDAALNGNEDLAAKRDKRGRTALHAAALNGNIQLCKRLLRINSRIIDCKDNDGRNALYDAVKGKHNEKDVTEILLAKYSRPDILLNDLIDRNGLTPLHVAASLGRKALVESLLASAKNREKYSKGRDDAKEASKFLKRIDFLGQTALHKAANCGDSDTVEILLNEGAHPLDERDCDGRTALHYAVKANTKEDKRKMIDLLLQGCKSNEEKWLLLWASAAGSGTADNGLSKDDPLHQFFEDKKKEIKEQLRSAKRSANLLKTAASVGNIEMTKELIARGYKTADIGDTEWSKDLSEKEKRNVDRVSGQLARIAEQGNDQPTLLDNLGRIDYAHGLAALLLNPYVKPPIVVGISGSWGMGKSSLMVQTESILLKTAAQMTFLPSAILSSSASELPEITTFELSKKGKKKKEEIKRHVEFEQKGNRRSLFSNMMDKIRRVIKKSTRAKTQVETGDVEQDSLVEFLNRDHYQAKYVKIFKSLAAMDSSDMFTLKKIMNTKEDQEDQEHQKPHSKSMWGMVRDMFTTRTRENQTHQNMHAKSMWQMARDMFTTNYQRPKSSPQTSRVDPLVEESVPAVLTVQYNAWKYRNETEALAGIAVEITKELEGIMTQAQWLSTCWRNTWKKKKFDICIEIFFPCLLTIVLACTITWILWVVLEGSNRLKNWAISKYTCLPIAIVIVGWTVTKSVMSILKPVSTQLMRYISFPDHTDKLGYQERVISDINFLKDEIGKEPCMLFKAYSWISTMISAVWLLFFEWWFTPLFFHPRILEKTVLIPKIAPASGANLRIIVFIDDLDRCQESVILQVLSAINLVLAVCEINVVMGIDKRLIERAIIKKHGDMKNKSLKDNQELADKYLQKIIQLPLDLPDPSEEQSMKFLKRQLGVFQEKNEDEAGKSTESTFWDITKGETKSVQGHAIDLPPAPMDTGCTRTSLVSQSFKGKLCKIILYIPSVFCGRKAQVKEMTSDASATLSGQTERKTLQGNRNYWSWIPITEMLFVRYSEGERDAFCHFQKLATDSRKLPREWKRHLTYHRLVWNIFYLTGEAKDLAGWQVKLITWIFICWEWQENMNIVIKNWKKIGIMKNSASDPPSLQRIVEHFIEVESSHEEREGREDEDKNIEIVSSEREEKKLTEDVGHPLFQEKKKEEVAEKRLEGNIDDQQRSSRDGLEKMDTAVIIQLRILEKRLDELKKEVNYLKDEVMKKSSRKNEKREEEKRMNLESWNKLKSALNKYDVPMDAIQAFQRFRFYCTAGHLSWPLPEQLTEKAEY